MRWWHPLPYWDMWSGYLGFWYRLADGDLSAWWVQHNEHRIVLARLLFWLDVSWLQGSGVLLLTTVVASTAIAAFVLLCLLRIRLKEEGPLTATRSGYLLIAAPTAALAFAWMQSENLIWGFQIAFVLSCLLGLCSFVALALSAQAGGTGRRATSWAIAALLCAAMAPWTIASGLLVPFLAAILAWLLRLSRLLVGILIATALASFIAYRLDYVEPAGHASPLQSLTGQPIEVLKYLVVFLGGPVWHTTGSLVLSQMAGAGLVLSAAIALPAALRGSARMGGALAALSFISFVILWGLITALGRVNFGVEQALSSRYQTPVLIAWACLLIVVAPTLLRRMAIGSLAAPIVILCLMLLLFQQQLGALSGDRDSLRHARDTAALALALGVDDPLSISAVAPESALPLTLSRRAMQDGLTVLGGAPYSSLASAIGTRLPSSASPVPCLGSIDSAEPVEASNFTRITGWTTAGADSRTRLLTLYDRTDQVVGFAAQGGKRDDVVLAVPGTRSNTGFVGYVLNEAASTDLRIGADGPFCQDLLPTTLNR